MSAVSPLPQRRILSLIFLTVFMDIVGFSIIIPLFPHLLEHYIKTEGSAGTLIGTLSSAAEWLGGDTVFKKPVLFGGLLSTLYSLLQFIFAPIWGSLSDRLGRRSILTLTLLGSALSYVLWIFAARFWVVVLTRLICGTMAGNIAVASAAAADVTDEKERTRGMAVVGIAIGLGFLCGPVIGGIAAPTDTATSEVVTSAFGLNLFSRPAMIAAFMAVSNFILVLCFFPETLPVKKRAKADAARPSIFDLATVKSAEVRKTSLANLIYQIGFTGMENTIVFLTLALFAYAPKDNAMLFLFNGISLVLAQGFARRVVQKVGQRRVILGGFITAAAAFLLVASIPAPVSPGMAAAWTKPVFFIGMAMISFATGLILPSVSALVSLYSDATEQGRNLGILRSAGSLARVVGPISAALIYFHFGHHLWVYVIAALLMIPAFLVIKNLPEPTSHSGS